MKLNKTLIGMVHVPALPGTPQHKMNMEDLIEHCVVEAVQLEKAGFDAIMLENMHDVPYLKGAVGPEIVAAMTVVARAIKEAVKVPVGIQILAAANKEALAVALAAELEFIRAEGFVFGHVGDEGYHDSCAGELLRYRKMIGAEHVKIFTDIKKKHSSHAITTDVSLLETAKAAEFFLSDGVIVTGKATGEAADLDELKSLKQKLGVPVIIGSGITAENLSNYWNLADAFIVGSYIKEGGLWENPLDRERMKQLVVQAKILQTRS